MSRYDCPVATSENDPPLLPPSTSVNTTDNKQDVFANRVSSTKDGSCSNAKDSIFDTKQNNKQNNHKNNSDNDFETIHSIKCCIKRCAKIYWKKCQWCRAPMMDVLVRSIVFVVTILLLTHINCYLWMDVCFIQKRAINGFNVKQNQPISCRRMKERKTQATQYPNFFKPSFQLASIHWQLHPVEEALLEWRK